MPRTKSNKPKRNIWTDDSSPYGTYEGEPGNPDQWKNAFEYMTMTRDQALSILKVGESPYDVLGVPRGSDIEVVKKAYRKLAVKSHTDKGGNREDFERYTAAYTLLKD